MGKLNLADIAPLELFEREIAACYINTQVHPTLPYKVLDYNQLTQFEGHWNAATLAARGLLINSETNEVIARPFSKFFNWGEREMREIDPALLSGPVSVTDKLDGCFKAIERVNLWGGGTMAIRDIVDREEDPTLVGLNEDGELVPTRIINRFNNGLKGKWLSITLDSPTDRLSGAGGHPNRMVVTPNHHLLVNGSYAAAETVKPGDVMVGQHFTPSESVMHLIKASLLGDGCLVYNNSSGVHYQESHSEKQEEYSLYLRSLLGDTGNSRPDTRSGYGSRLIWAGSKTYQSLRAMREEWYPERGKKVVPADLSWIDDFAVAKWYMDDGSLAHNKVQVQQDRAYFATNGFSEEDVRRLAQKLTEMYGVSCAIYFSKGWNLRVNAGRDSAINAMWKAIAPHMHPSLRYKLPEAYRDVEFQPYEVGSELRISKPVTVLAVEDHRLPNGYKSVSAYDIETETHNYMVDGVIVHNSMGTSYPTPDGLAIATRGSFASEQALHATKVYRERYHGRWEPQAGRTYLFEIIYPTNRIVVNYGDTDDIVLLSAIDIATGRSTPAAQVSEWPGKKVEEFSFDSIEDVLAAEPREGVEGYVVHFTDSDVRVKIKQADYVTLHRIMTGVNSRRVWEELAEGRDVERFLSDVPEEFGEFVRGTAAKIQSDFDAKLATLSEQIEQAAAATAGMEQKEKAAYIFANFDKLAAHRILGSSRGIGPKTIKSIWQEVQPPFERSFFAGQMARSLEG